MDSIADFLDRFTYLEAYLFVFVIVTQGAAIFLIVALYKKKELYHKVLESFREEQRNAYKRNWHRIIYYGHLNGQSIDRFVYLFTFGGVNVFFRFSDQVFIPDYLPSNEIAGEERKQILEWLFAQSSPKSASQVKEQITQFNQLFPKMYDYHYSEKFFQNLPSEQSTLLSNS